MGRRISENSWINLKCEYRDLVKRLFYRINLYVCMYVLLLLYELCGSRDSQFRGLIIIAIENGGEKNKKKLNRQSQKSMSKSLTFFTPWHDEAEEKSEWPPESSTHQFPTLVR